MIIVGELINGTRKAIREAIAARDAETIADLARRQAEAGAAYIDCNPGTTGEQEIADLVWLTETVQAAVRAPISFDTPNPGALRAALDVYKGPPPLINSISGEQGRLEAMLPLALESGASVVALLIGGSQMPRSAEERVAIAQVLVTSLIDGGLRPEQVFIDPAVLCVGTDPAAGVAVLRTIAQMRELFPQCHITGGLSNVSYGLPNRRLLNRTFMAMAVACGLDSAIIDPLDREMVATIYAAEALAGRDEWCMNYIQAHRDGLL
ncbi:MAG: dihydropteroate synthase [Armatimonadetes bacterium]|nr:dihydropteroate synthase [Armatimonadota bacterium]